MNEPTTAAGKRLLEEAFSLVDPCVPLDPSESIVAIEREAREEERAYHRETRHLVVDGSCREAVAAALARVRERVIEHVPEIEGYCGESDITLGCSCGWWQPRSGATWEEHISAAVLAILDEKAG